MFFEDLDGDSQNELFILVHVSGKSGVGEDGERSEYNDFFTDIYRWDGAKFIYDLNSEKFWGLKSEDAIKEKLESIK